MNLVLRNLQKTLKEQIKAQGLTYEILTKELDVSKATIKRILNSEDTSFTHLTDLCRALGIDFYEAVEKTRRDQRPHLYSFSEKQEALLSKNKKNFLIFRSLLLGKDRETLQREFSLSNGEINKLLREMEERKLIERHPYDRIKILARFPFKWREGGPLEKVFGPIILSRISDEILSQGLNSRRENHMNTLFEWALDEETSQQMVKDLEEVIDKYRNAAHLQIKKLGKDFTPTTGVITVGRYHLW